MEISYNHFSSQTAIVVTKTSEDRFCVDYRFLNMLTNRTTFPIPRINDALSELTGFVVFHTLNLKSGYWQVPVAKKDQPLTSFTCSSVIMKST